MKSVLCVVATVAVVGFCPAVRADHHLEPVDLAGTWKAEASIDQGSREVTWIIRKSGDKFSGVHVDSQSGDESLFDNITVNAKKVALEIKVERNGNTGVIKVDAEEKSPGKLVGKWSLVGSDGTERMSGDITAVREVAFAGKWTATSTSSNGPTVETEMVLAGKNSALSGTLGASSVFEETDFDKVSVTDDGLRMEFQLELQNRTVNCAIEAKANGNDKLDGKWIILGGDGSEVAQGEWSAVRKPAGFAGTWATTATVPNYGEVQGQLTLNEKDGQYSGTSENSNGETTKLSSVKVNGKELEIEFPFERDNISGTIKVEAKQQDDGSLKGEWSLTRANGNEAAREAWKATRP